MLVSFGAVDVLVGVRRADPLSGSLNAKAILPIVDLKPRLELATLLPSVSMIMPVSSSTSTRSPSILTDSTIG